MAVSIDSGSFLVVLTMRALLFGVCIRYPCFFETPIHEPGSSLYFGGCNYLFYMSCIHGGCLLSFFSAHGAFVGLSKRSHRMYMGCWGRICGSSSACRGCVQFRTGFIGFKRMAPLADIILVSWRVVCGVCLRLLMVFKGFLAGLP